MSSTTQPTDFSDLFTELLNRTRSNTTATAVINQATRYINMALYDLVLGFEYQMPWLERNAIILTHAPYTTGTVSISVGSSTLTGASTLWNTANAYSQNNTTTRGKLLLGGATIYTISAVGGDTAITLNEKYIGSAALSASQYTYFEDEYTLAADFLRPIDYRTFSTAYNIKIVVRNEFRRVNPRPNQAGTPRYATLLDKPFAGNTTPVKYVQFYPYPATTMHIPYAYITSNLVVSSTGVEAAQLSANTDEPNLPKGMRYLIVLKALEMWYRDKKDDARTESVKQEYQDTLLRVVQATDLGQPLKAQRDPMVSRYERYARKPYSGVASGRRYSHDNSFDFFRS